MLDLFVLWIPIPFVILYQKQSILMLKILKLLVIGFEIIVLEHLTFCNNFDNHSSSLFYNFYSNLKHHQLLTSISPINEFVTFVSTLKLWKNNIGSAINRTHITELAVDSYKVVKWTDSKKQHMINKTMNPVTEFLHYKGFMSYRSEYLNSFDSRLIEHQRM